MRNQYQAIGRLIMNLRNGRFLEDEKGNQKGKDNG